MAYLSEFLTFIAGLASGWILKIFVDKSKNSTKITGNIAGGDIAGRDITRKR